MTTKKKAKSKTRTKRGKSPGRLYLQHTPGAKPGGLGVPGGLRQRPVMQLENGELGYGMDPARCDDCLRPACATLLQVPVEQIPDPRLDDRLEAGDDPQQINVETWTRLAYWLRGRGLRLTLHETVPVDRERWIGVVECRDGTPSFADRFAWEDTPFADHCLVMTYERVYFDPAVSIKLPQGMRLHSWHPSQVAWGFTCDPIEIESEKE